jgi:DNA-directed RNA polymerase specialized sigma24 family protein
MAARSKDVGEKTGGTASNQASGESAGRRSGSQPGLLQKAHRELVAPLSVCLDAGGQGDPVARGWCSSRPIRTFEDAVIFVLDIEKCLSQLGSLDRMLLSRIVLQEYTQAEAATLLGMSVRTVCYKFPQALDRLTEKLLESGLLVLPH